MDDVEARERVKKWLEYCDDNNIKPWEFDFKQCYIKEKIKKTTNHLRLEIAFKSNLLTETNNEFNVTNEKGGKADCDKEALPMYRILGWQKSMDDPIRGESMNSFLTTFRSLIYATQRSLNNTKNLPFNIENKQFLVNQQGEIPKLSDLLKYWVTDNELESNLKKIIKSHYKKYNKKEEIEKSNKFLKELKTFAKLTHSIGNFIVFPSWMNTGRAGQSLCDYWDLALRDLRDFFLEIDYDQGIIVWKKFIKKYYLQPYVDKNYIPQELWSGHFKSDLKPQSNMNFLKFYKNINLLIIERGKWVTKKLYEKVYSGEELNECSLYQTELANLELHYFEEATTQTQKN